MNKLTQNSFRILRKILTLFFIFCSLMAFSQGVAINGTSNAANPSAGLDVDFTNKGLLLTRVALLSTTSPSPLSAHVAGMMVYNTATTGDVVPGLYLNNGSKWLPTIPPTGNANGDLQYWNGTAWVNLPAGQTGQKLQLTSAGLPAWSNGITSTLTTATTSASSSTTAVSGGNITSDGGSIVSVRGVCWNTATSPTLANSFTTDGTGMGNFVSNLSGLNTGTTYYIRAYATNANGTSYGNEITITTP
jgi:hypothetical protein